MPNVDASWVFKTNTCSITDGKRLVSVGNDKDATGGISLEICHNGYQTTNIGLDREMLTWLHVVVNEYIDHEN